MTKKQLERAESFEAWLKAKNLRSESKYISALRKSREYVERLATKFNITNGITSDELPVVSLYEFTKPSQLKVIFEKSKGRITTPPKVGVGDHGFFHSALVNYVEWLRLNLPSVWKKEPMWDGGKTDDKKEQTPSLKQPGAKSNKGASAGFVYILTNPSFRKDWVKIGKTKRMVDVRSKELDNTAVPLPFEIYATFETSDCDKVESMIHDTIDSLAPKARVRKEREFFKLLPSKAAKIFAIVAKLRNEESGLKVVGKK